MKHILISGFNSYIGNHFCKKYKKKYKIINYKEDINNISKFKLFTKKKKIDFFIHFASLSRIQCDVNQKLCKRTNFLSIKNIINYFNTLKFKPNFIFMSSSHVYTNSSNKIREEYKKKPESLYGKLKLQSENYLKKNYKKYCILRLFNVYGKNQPENFFIPDINKKIKLQKIITLNKSKRDFIHVKDVVKIINFIIKNNINDTINVGSGRGLLLSSIVKIVSSQNKIKPLLKINSKNDKLIANISKLRSIGYTFKIDKINEKNFNI
ncbi:MAG: SDR family oxidoreductase [Candidatus Pelagibacter sp.]